MGKGSLRNKVCKCGSGKKYKKCCYNIGEKESMESKEEMLKELSKQFNVEKDGVRFHLLDIIDHSKLNPDDEHFQDLTWYLGICDIDESNRIINIKDGQDYLLKVRADSILNHMRIYRVMLARKRKNEDNWNLSTQFSKEEFNNYLDYLDDEKKEKCKMIPSGYVFSDDPNGALMRTDYGDIIVVSESLRHFLFYMNLFMADFDYDIPHSVRLDALRIAIRIMLQTESLDFELDPRGIIPNKVQIINDVYVEQQLQFVIGHEYAHYLLNHLDKNNTYSSSLFSNSIGVIDRDEYMFYNHDQMQEFEADEYSVTFPEYDKTIFDEKVNSALYFFAYIELYEQAKEQIFPSMNHIKTHPPAIERMWNIFEKTKDKLEIIDKSYIQELNDTIMKIKEILQEDIACNFDVYEQYGSVYLSEWKGKELIDRVDY